MDMMRPMVFTVAHTLARAPVVHASVGGGAVNLTWTDGTPYNYATGLPKSTLDNPRNEIGFRIERAKVGATGGSAPTGSSAGRWPT